MVFQAGNFKKKVNYKNYKNQQSAELLAILRGPNRLLDTIVSIKVYTCRYSIVKDLIFMSKYYVAAGPGNRSVILLEEMKSFSSHKPYYEIIDFVEYLTEEYLYYYFQNLY